MNVKETEAVKANVLLVKQYLTLNNVDVDV